MAEKKDKIGKDQDKINQEGTERNKNVHFLSGMKGRSFYKVHFLSGIIIKELIFNILYLKVKSDIGEL